MAQEEKFQFQAPDTAKLDRALHALGFKYEFLSPEKVTGKLKVTETCCQPFNVLSGGVSALLAEAMASLGAYIASGYKRVAGVQLAINHFRPTLLGELVEAEARPIQRGRSIQVWEVEIWKINPSTPEKKTLVSSSRVTLLCSQHAANDTKAYEQMVKKCAKL
ncbi:1,4-dihydroxy-2-naphthoyl-CoA hydrolase protein [Dioscorea alata]|uniref:1,4-dihydroxy-2-naphthoyl-CoA hydrolase protein n=1 Tax=Dioscorea alata TaxID=55571 RepID=A0ACB7VNY0_DIOAL|nr:1,4-dihydroxy-2-naphthoyl-CoA hydrolase protein [Dioscorea alata]